MDFLLDLSDSALPGKARAFPYFLPSRGWMDFLLDLSDSAGSPGFMKLVRNGSCCMGTGKYIHVAGRSHGFILAFDSDRLLQVCLGCMLQLKVSFSFAEKEQIKNMDGLSCSILSKVLKTVGIQQNSLKFNEVVLVGF
jgi:hypothetical protein